MSQLNSVLIAEDNPTSPVAECYRTLRTAIRHKRVKSAGDGVVLMVASPKPGEGKTTTIANLAVTFAQDGKKAVVVDGNFRHPALHEAFGLASGKGLVSYLRSSASAEQILSASGLPQLDLVLAGGEPANPSELLGSARMERLLEELRAMYDIVLIDSPAALDYTDAGLLAELSDGVILVIKHGRTKREWASKARSRLEEAGARMLGIVLNK